MFWFCCCCRCVCSFVEDDFVVAFLREEDGVVVEDVGVAFVLVFVAGGVRDFMFVSLLLLLVRDLGVVGVVASAAADDARLPRPPLLPLLVVVVLPPVDERDDGIIYL